MTSFRIRSPRVLVVALLAPLALLLGGCTITFVGPGDGAFGGVAAPLIESFQVRGGDEVRVGQQIAFQIRTRQDGYVTLTSPGPSGSVNVFARNMPVAGGRTVVLDGRSQGGVFVVEPPRGWHRVRASFTPAPTDTGRVRFVGRSGENDWYAAIRIDVEPFEVSDVAETRFFVR
jgi:hypothetical protein